MAEIRPQLMTVSEVAAALRVSDRKVWYMLGTGAIPSVSLGRNRRVRVEALQAYIESLSAEGGHDVAAAI